jgi:hypothetical protein
MSLALMTPIVLKVEKGNNHVISVFGSIPTYELRKLSEKCDSFKAQHLKDKYAEILEE